MKVLTANRVFLPFLLLTGCLASGTARQAVLAPQTTAAPLAAGAIDAQRYREDAAALEGLINENYAYLDRFPGGVMPMSDRLRGEAAAVHDRDSLVRYAERVLLMLADHHAALGSNVADSWQLVPTSVDLWVEKCGLDYRIDAVRPRSPSSEAGIAAGDRLVVVDGVPIAEAVEAFWANLGRSYDNEAAGFAARLLAGGKRDRLRRLTISRGTGAVTEHRLPNLAQLSPSDNADGAPVTTAEEDSRLVVTVNNSLYRNETIAAFDAAMAKARPGQPIVLDLTNTPSGGNTTVARAILGWFVDRPRFYQVHSIPSEQRRWGVVRQWFEEVHPRPGKSHRGPVEVRVGRWTGSMGEGLAIGFDAIGIPVTGDRMAGLRGAIWSLQLERTKLRVNLPGERLMHINRTPRESFAPADAATCGIKTR